MIFALNSPIASAASLSLAAQFGLVGVWSEVWLPGRGIVLGETLLASGTSPPAVTIVDTPDTPTGLWIDMQNSDIFGDAYFKWSVDDGATWSGNVYTGHNVDLGNGFVVDFAEAAYNADNLYKATVASWAGLWGYTASQATASKQPVYSSVAWDGNPCLTFDGVDDILVCAESALVSPYVGTDVNTVLVAAHDSSDATATVVCLGGVDGTGTAQYHLGSASADYYYRGATSLSVAAGSGRRHTIVRNVGTSWEILRNGSSIAGPSTRASTTMAPGRLSIGAYLTDALETYRTAGNIAAVLLGSTCSDAAGLTALLQANGVQ